MSHRAGQAAAAAEKGSRERSGSFGKRLTRALRSSVRRRKSPSVGVEDEDDAPIMTTRTGSEGSDCEAERTGGRMETDRAPNDVFILHQAWKKETEIARLIAGRPARA